MKFKALFVVAAVALLIVGCYLPWITVESKALTITGMNTTGTRYGKPGLFHLIWSGLFLIFGSIGAIWSQRIALLVAAFNLAWALKNFLFIPACQMGDCPVRKIGLYMILTASLLMFTAIFFSQDKPASQRDTLIET